LCARARLSRPLYPHHLRAKVGEQHRGMRAWTHPG
jgi:hypothetical protein